MIELVNMVLILTLKFWITCSMLNQMKVGMEHLVIPAYTIGTDFSLYMDIRVGYAPFKDLKHSIMWMDFILRLWVIYSLIIMLSTDSRRRYYSMYL
jgi:hypothetical protein